VLLIRRKPAWNGGDEVAEQAPVPAVAPGPAEVPIVPSVVSGASAISKDMLVKRFQAFASEMLVHPVHELVGR